MELDPNKPVWPTGELSRYNGTSLQFCTVWSCVTSEPFLISTSASGLKRNDSAPRRAKFDISTKHWGYHVSSDRLPNPYEEQWLSNNSLWPQISMAGLLRFGFLKALKWCAWDDGKCNVLNDFFFYLSITQNKRAKIYGLNSVFVYRVVGYRSNITSKAKKLLTTLFCWTTGGVRAFAIRDQDIHSVEVKTLYQTSE